MASDMYELLKFASFKNIPNWSVQYLDIDSLGFKKNFKLMRIGSFLEKSKDIIEIKNDIEYRQLTIKTNNGGVIPRNNGYPLLGSRIGTKRQNVVHEGQFIMSKIDARNGAFGLVPENLEGAIVTNDFPVFNIDTEKILPDFLLLVSTSKKFVEFVRKCSSGTTNRKRIDIEAFLQQQIPLPNIEEQKMIVEQYNGMIAQVSQKQKEIMSIADDSYKVLRDSLAMESKDPDEYPSGLQFINFKDTSNRWDAFRNPFKVYSRKFETHRLGDYILHISTGTTPPTSHPEYFDGSIKFFTPADLGSDKYLEKTSRTISHKAIEDRKARLFHRGDILFVGIGSTVGKVGIVRDNFASSNQQISGFTLDCDKINPEYVYYFLQFNRDISTAEQSKTTLPIVNQEKIANIPIIVPPLEIQNELVADLDIMYQRVKNNEMKITLLRKEAVTFFENKIFENNETQTY